MPAANALARATATRIVVRHARAAGVASRPRAMPRAQPPDHIARDYAARLVATVRRARTEAFGPLLAALPGLLAGADRDREDSARADEGETRRARELVAVAKQRMAGAIRVEGVASDAAGKVSAHQRVQLGRQAKAVLGIDLLGGDQRLRPIVDGFVQENVSLISDITPRLAAQVEAAVLKALTTGQPAADLARELAERFEIADRRAEFIATDQIGKLNGQVAVQRAKDLGVTHFYWRTVGDERVRGTPGGKYPKADPSHYARNGKRYAFADPPKGRKGELELPGVAVNCRCYSEPDLDSLLAGPEPEQAPDPAEAARVEATARLAAREAQAARERAEWEALRAAQVAAETRRQAGQVAAVQALAERYATATARAQARMAEDRANVDAVRAMSREEMSGEFHPAFEDNESIYRGTTTGANREIARAEFQQLVRDNGFKRVSVEEMTHAFAPPPGYTAKIAGIDPAGANGPEINLTYHDKDGTTVAHASREFRPGGDLHHALLTVEEGHQGAGFAAAINGQALLRYEKWGVKEVTVDAAWVGRYTWARMGFSFDAGIRDGDGRSEIENVYVAGDKFIDEKIAPEKRDAYKAKLRELAKEPWRLAAWDDGAKHDVFFDNGDKQQTGSYPLGKALLLDHRMPIWSGKLRISEGDAGYKNALRSVKVSERK